MSCEGSCKGRWVSHFLEDDLEEIDCFVSVRKWDSFSHPFPILWFKNSKSLGPQISLSDPEQLYLGPSYPNQWSGDTISVLSGSSFLCWAIFRLVLLFEGPSLLQAADFASLGPGLSPWHVKGHWGSLWPSQHCSDMVALVGAADHEGGHHVLLHSSDAGGRKNATRETWLSIKAGPG